MADICRICRNPIIGRAANARLCHACRDSRAKRNHEKLPLGKCETCGLPITGKTARARFCTTCSQVRTRQSNKQACRRARGGLTIPERKVCPTCDRVFIGRSNQKFCSQPCRGKAGKKERADKIKAADSAPKLARGPVVVYGDNWPIRGAQFDASTWRRLLSEKCLEPGDVVLSADGTKMAYDGRSFQPADRR